MVLLVFRNGFLDLLIIWGLLICFHRAKCFDLGNWEAQGTSSSCDQIRGNQLFDSVITDNLQGAKDFFETLRSNSPNVRLCRTVWDRYFPLPRPEFPDSPFLRTPLMEASRKGNIAMVQLLLNRGADINKQEGGRWTPLMWAAYQGHLRITRLLTSSYANLDAKDMLGETALKLAAGNGQLITVKYLVSRGADINAQDVNGHTALMEACKNGWWGVAWALIEGGADINMKDREGKTALMLTIIVAKNIDIVKMLVERGDYWTVNSRDNEDKTAMDYASEKKQFKIMRYLASKGAN